MPNKNRGERKLTGKNNKNYTVVFTTNAIAQAEEELGTGIGTVMGHYMTGAFSIRETIILLWAGLLKNHAGDEGISTEDAGDTLDEILAKSGDLGAVFEVLMEAVNDALPFKTAGANQGPQKQTLKVGKKAQESGGVTSLQPRAEQG